MYQHILVPTDGSDLSKRAITQAVRFAQSIGAKITGIHVMPEYSSAGSMEFPAYSAWTLDEFTKETEVEAKRALAVVEEESKKAGVACQTMYVRSNYAHEAIIDAARSRKCDLIFMASHGRRGLSALVLGSETHKVLTHSKIPVLVHR